jgi:hypothetical protein
MGVLAIVGRVDLRRILHAFGWIIGAMMVGVGTIFQPKARIDDHWSTRPKVVMVDEIASETSGDPPGLDT